MGIASLLWRLASEDEETLGRARIQPHGLEAVVPPSGASSRKKKKKLAKRRGDDEVGGGGASSTEEASAALDAAARNAASDARRVSSSSATTTTTTTTTDDDDDDDGGGDSVEKIVESSILSSLGETIEMLDEEARARGAPRRADDAGLREDEEKRDARRKEAAATAGRKNSGRTRSAETRRKIAGAARERWRAARENATNAKTAEVAATVHALKRGAAAAAAKAAAAAGRDAVSRAEGVDRDDAVSRAEGVDRDDAVAPTPRGVVQPREAPFNPSAPWEALALGAGQRAYEETIAAIQSFDEDDDDDDDDASFESPNASSDDVADRAAAFAALLTRSGEVPNSIAARASMSTSTSSIAKAGVGAAPAPAPAYAAFEDDDDDDDPELKETKRKMKKRLADLAKKRAELTGSGVSPSLTVAKFSADLQRYKRLRDDLKEWSAAFVARRGRIPTVKDVERTGIDFLVKNFKDYVALRDKLMSQTPYLRGQMEDVARETLPTPRAAGWNKKPRQGGTTRDGGQGQGQGQGQGHPGASFQGKPGPNAPRYPAAYGSALKWPGVAGGGPGKAPKGVIAIKTRSSAAAAAAAEKPTAKPKPAASDDGDAIAADYWENHARKKGEVPQGPSSPLPPQPPPLKRRPAE